MSTHRPPPHHHGHSHSHGTDVSVSARTTRIVTWILVPLGVLTAIALIFLWPGSSPAVGGSTVTQQRAYGEVLAVREHPCPATGQPPGSTRCGQATVHLSDGPGKDTTIVVDLPQGPGAPTLATGEKVVLAYDP